MESFPDVIFLIFELMGSFFTYFSALLVRFWCFLRSIFKTVYFFCFHFSFTYFLNHGVLLQELLLMFWHQAPFLVTKKVSRTGHWLESECRTKLQLDRQQRSIATDSFRFIYQKPGQTRCVDTAMTEEQSKAIWQLGPAGNS